jgi:hypothetical protein
MQTNSYQVQDANMSFAGNVSPPMVLFEDLETATTLRAASTTQETSVTNWKISRKLLRWLATFGLHRYRISIYVTPII